MDFISNITEIVAVGGSVIALLLKLTKDGLIRDVQEAVIECIDVQRKYEVAMADGTLSKEEIRMLSNEMAEAIKKIGDVIGHGQVIWSWFIRRRKPK